jgi:hypothetical protein
MLRRPKFSTIKGNSAPRRRREEEIEVIKRQIDFQDYVINSL